jgi:hypothetical protein
MPTVGAHPETMLQGTQRMNNRRTTRMPVGKHSTGADPICPKLFLSLILLLLFLPSFPVRRKSAASTGSPTHAAPLSAHHNNDHVLGGPICTSVSVIRCGHIWNAAFDDSASETQLGTQRKRGRWPIGGANLVWISILLSAVAGSVVLRLRFILFSSHDGERVDKDTPSAL